MSDLLNNDDIQTINIEETLQNSYLDYSMSVIVGLPYQMFVTV